MPASPVYRNLHGRKWGRGLRPWALLPKVILVAFFVGGLAGTLLLVLLAPAPQTPGEWAAHLVLIQRAFGRLVVPSLVGAMVAGAVLTAMHWRALLRMRWLQVKLVLIAVCVPAAHLLMRGRLLLLEEAVARAEHERALALRGQMSWGTGAVIVFALVVLILGRLKPRLGQGYAKAARADTATESEI